MIIRQMVDADCAIAAQLHAESFAPPWTEASLRASLSSAGAVGYIASENHRRPLEMGFVLARQVGDEAEILTIAVAPSARRMGVARALVEKLQHHMRPEQSIFLEVAETNNAARALYAAVGFGMIGERPRYYGETTALLLQWTKSVETGVEAGKAPGF